MDSFTTQGNGWYDSENQVTGHLHLANNDKPFHSGYSAYDSQSVLSDLFCNVENGSSSTQNEYHDSMAQPVQDTHNDFSCGAIGVLDPQNISYNQGYEGSTPIYNNQGCSSATTAWSFNYTEVKESSFSRENTLGNLTQAGSFKYPEVIETSFSGENTSGNSNHQETEVSGGSIIASNDWIFHSHEATGLLGDAPQNTFSYQAETSAKLTEVDEVPIKIDSGSQQVIRVPSFGDLSQLSNFGQAINGKVCCLLTRRKIRAYDWPIQTCPDMEAKRKRAIRALKHRKSGKSEELQNKQKLQSLKAEVSDLRRMKQQSMSSINELERLLLQYSLQQQEQQQQDYQPCREL